MIKTDLTSNDFGDIQYQLSMRERERERDARGC
jgi:hypothetical protein